VTSSDEPVVVRRVTGDATLLVGDAHLVQIAETVSGRGAFCVTRDGRVICLPARLGNGSWLSAVPANTSVEQFFACVSAVEAILRRCPTPRKADGRVDVSADTAVYEATADEVREAVARIDPEVTQGFWDQLYWDVAIGDWAEVGRG
jgi:hypothetical protein